MLSFYLFCSVPLFLFVPLHPSLSCFFQAKAELNRYLHYYQRYHNHDQSRKFAERQRVLAEKRMTALQQASGGGSAWIDFQFLAGATNQILECRAVLKYTYVYAYYLPEGPEKRLFEFLQQQLEASTEQLSEFRSENTQIRLGIYFFSLSFALFSLLFCFSFSSGGCSIHFYYYFLV